MGGGSGSSDSPNVGGGTPSASASAFGFLGFFGFFGVGRWVARPDTLGLKRAVHRARRRRVDRARRRWVDRAGWRRVDVPAGGGSTVPAGAGSTVPAGGGSTVPAGGGAASSVVEGAGSAPGASSVAPVGVAGLLDSPSFTAPPTVRTWLESGGVDPRVVSMLDSVLAHHTIGVSNLEVLSSPVHVQSFDIVSVDGQPVGPDNFAARDLVTEIAAMDPTTRPDEIGTPWPIQSPGFSTGPASTNGLHLAFEMPGTNATPTQDAAYTGAASGTGAAPMDYAIGAQPAAGAGVPVYAGTGPASVQQLSPAAVAPGTHGAGVVGSVLAAGPSVGSSPHTGPTAVLDYARSMIGKLPESSGPNMGPALDRFEAQYGFHGAPWCGIFAGHALQAAGLKVPHSVASVASILDLARNGDPPFVKGILPISQARPGDLATFGGAEHVAIITKIDAAGVHTIAGNTSQSNVSETIYSPSSVTGVVRPDYALAPHGGAARRWRCRSVPRPQRSYGARSPRCAPGGRRGPRRRISGHRRSRRARSRRSGSAGRRCPNRAGRGDPSRRDSRHRLVQSDPRTRSPPPSPHRSIPPSRPALKQPARPSRRGTPHRPSTGRTGRRNITRSGPRNHRPRHPRQQRRRTRCGPGAGDRSRASDFAERYVDPRLSRLARTDQDGGGRRRRQPATGIEPEPGRAGRRTGAMAAASWSDGLVTIRPTEVPRKRSEELVSRAVGADERSRESGRGRDPVL